MTTPRIEQNKPGMIALTVCAYVVAYFVAAMPASVHSNLSSILGVALVIVAMWYQLLRGAGGVCTDISVPAWLTGLVLLLKTRRRVREMEQPGKIQKMPQINKY